MAVIIEIFICVHVQCSIASATPFNKKMELVKRLMNTEGYYREILEEYLDGLTGQVCEEGDVQYDGYERRRDTETEMETASSGRRTEMEDRMKERKISRQLRQQER
jgi:hypothetical protein